MSAVLKKELKKENNTPVKWFLVLKCHFCCKIYDSEHRIFLPTFSLEQSIIDATENREL